jgi:D-serine dehydratase
LLDSKSFDGFASASVYAPSGVKTLTQYHLPARSTVQSVQNSLLDYTWDYNPERILDRKWRCYNYFSTFSIFTGGGFIVGFILGVIGVMLGIKVPKVFII